MTLATVIGVVNLMLVVANCRVFKHLHERDEEIGRMMVEGAHFTPMIPYHRTGT